MIGKAVSHYKILEKLGGGGMGVVYKAEDTRLKRTATLKFLPSILTSNPQANERFTREAQAVSALDHPTICNIYGINESDDGQLLMAMACVEGETLRKKIERGPLPLNDVGRPNVTVNNPRFMSFGESLCDLGGYPYHLWSHRCTGTDPERNILGDSTRRFILIA